MSDEIQVAVVNRSHLSQEDVADGVAALREQVRGDFAAAWHVEADLIVVDRGQTVGPVWGLVLYNGSAAHAVPGPQHDFVVALSAVVASSTGLPLALVDVDAVPAGQDWTHLASHRLLETLVAPVISGATYRQLDAGAGARLPCFSLYAREVCDPCAGYEDGYQCHGRQVSDFVWPAWFGMPGHGPTNYDERRHLDAPFQVRPSGWAHVFDLQADAWKVFDDRGGEIDPAIPPDDRLGRLMRCLVTKRLRSDGLLYPP